MQEIVLQTNNLTKKYKDFVALDNATITITKNQIKIDFLLILFVFGSIIYGF